VAPAAIDPRLARAGEHEQAGRLAEAAALCTDILASRPDDAPALNLLGIIAYRQGRLTEAIALVERAVARDGDEAVYRRNLCELDRLAGRLDAALEHGRRAVALAPDDAHAHYNLGLVHADRLELDAAIAAERAALAREPGFAGAHFELAEALLLQGELAAAWDAYEWRWQLPSAPAHMRALAARPTWAGEPLGGRALLLIADQGFGDTIQFMRYIPAVAARCPDVMIACGPEMAPLIAQQPGTRALFDIRQPVPRFDVHCPLSSLPRAFGTTLATIPTPMPYLRAAPEAAARWRARLDARAPAGHRRIGLVWAGRPEHENDRNRSLPLATLAPLGALARTALVALQLGPARAQIAGYAGAAPLIDLAPEIADFTDTMAILEALDLVVAVDTAVAHLAGAMAKPVALLLPFAPDWRWLTGRADSPWYPSVRLFRQPAPGAWDAAVGALAQSLAR
jgi:Flp pilus assembly protein TadD